MHLCSISTPSLTASALGLWASIIALLSVKVGGELVACGTVPGRANFPADGQDLKIAVRCYYDGQGCSSGNLASKASIQAYYGYFMEDWCISEVTTLASLFMGLTVS